MAETRRLKLVYLDALVTPPARGPNLLRLFPTQRAERGGLRAGVADAHLLHNGPLRLCAR